MVCLPAPTAISCVILRLLPDRLNRGLAQQRRVVDQVECQVHAFDWRWPPGMRLLTGRTRARKRPRRPWSNFGDFLVRRRRYSQ